MADDDIPELEDFSEELSKIRKQKGEKSEKAELKVNVINNQSGSANNTKTVEPKKETKKDDIDDFGKGFKKGFFRKQNQQTKPQPKPQTQQTQKSNVEDLTHIKSNPGTTSKTKTVENFSNDLKTAQNEARSGSGLLNNIVEKKNEWLNQDLLMKIAQHPNLMKCFMGFNIK